MATWLLAIGLPLIFFMPFVGIPMFLVGWWLAVSEDKEEAARKKEAKKKNDAHWYYHHNKWTNPISPKVFDAAETDNRNHNGFLKKQVERIENYYRKNGMHPRFPQIQSFSASDDRIDELFATPKKYIAVTKSIGRKPIRELLDDWQGQLEADREVDLRRERDSKEAHTLNHSKLLSIKARVVAKVESGLHRKEIIDEVKSENADLRNLTIWRENDVWNIELGGDIVKFKVPAD